MRIIREGNKQLAEIRFNRVRQFECHNCYCIWQAGKGEYKAGAQYNQEYFYMPCPCCGETTYASSAVEIDYQY